MFDKLESLVERLDTVLQQLNDPDVAGDQNRFRDLMKEYGIQDRKSTRLNSSHW